MKFFFFFFVFFFQYLFFRFCSCCSIPASRFHLFTLYLFKKIYSFCCVFLFLYYAVFFCSIFAITYFIISSIIIITLYLTTVFCLNLILVLCNMLSLISHSRISHPIPFCSVLFLTHSWDK